MHNSVFGARCLNIHDVIIRCYYGLSMHMIICNWACEYVSTKIVDFSSLLYYNLITIYINATIFFTLLQFTEMKYYTFRTEDISLV